MNEYRTERKKITENRGTFRKKTNKFCRHMWMTKQNSRRSQRYFPSCIGLNVFVDGGSIINITNNGNHNLKTFRVKTKKSWNLKNK